MARSRERTRLFQQLHSPGQRRDEICHASFHEDATADQLAARFGLPVGTGRVIVRDFARDPDLNAFFTADRPGPKHAPKRTAIQPRACELRRHGTTLAETRAALLHEGFDVRESSLFRVLDHAGWTATRPQHATPHPGVSAQDGSVVPDMADVHALSLEDGRLFPTQVAGLFRFLPRLLDREWPQAVLAAGLPGWEQIPPRQAWLALLVPKLLGQRRISPLRDLWEDEGAGRFAGLNIWPKVTSATDSASKTERTRTERRIAAVIAQTPLGDPPRSFPLDFPAIPFRGAEPDLENHGVPTRNHALPTVLAVITQAVGRRVICSATAHVLRAEADGWVPKFADHGPEPTGHDPARWLCDWRATTSAGWSQRTQRQVGFIPMRRRGSGLWARVERRPAESGPRGPIPPAQSQRRPVASVDAGIPRDGYDDAVRPGIVTGLGHESPTFFLTHDRPPPQTARDVIPTYARRNHGANQLGEQIRFFPRDGLGSDVRRNVAFDLTLTVLAALLYRRLAERLTGWAQSGPSRVFRQFVATPGTIAITTNGVIVRWSKRAHNPLRKEARLMPPTRAVPWLGGRCVHLVCP